MRFKKIGTKCLNDVLKDSLIMSLSSKKRSLKRASEGPPTSPSHVTILARKKRQQAELAMKATEKVLLYHNVTMVTPILQLLISTSLSHGLEVCSAVFLKGCWSYILLIDTQCVSTII